MKLLVIGHSVEDLIIYKDKKTVKPGGLYYTAASLASIKDSGDEIILCTSSEESNYSLFSPVYSMLNTSCIINQPGGIPKVMLTIYDDREREEKYDRLGGNIEVPLDKIENPDGILINMITGFDITVDQLSEIRKKFTCPVYMDVHTLSRGVTEDFERPQRLIPGFSEWAENLDIIQVNENELFSLYDLNSETEIAGKVLSEGVKCLIVTKAEKGAKIYFKKSEGVQSVFKSAAKITVRNKVGCGDVFGAVFFYLFIKFGDLISSLSFANYAAGIISSYEKFNDEIWKLKKDVFARYN